jgi:hypothetical protein
MRETPEAMKDSHPLVLSIDVGYFLPEFTSVSRNWADLSTQAMAYADF